MTSFDLLMTLVLRAALLALPIAIGLLALRRLFLSRSPNAWVYALMTGYAALSVSGLLPWALGFTDMSVLAVASALAAPAIWSIIVVVCGLGRMASYAVAPVDETGREPLYLTDPILPGPDPAPVFRHAPRRPVAPAERPDTSLMDVARSMRGRATSEARRVRKLLPPPDPGPADLPFIR